MSELAAIRSRFHTLIATAMAGAQAIERHVEVRRLIEQNPCFADLTVQAVTFPMVRQLIGRDITLASAGEGDCRPAHTGAYISWHNDFTWMPDVAYPLPNSWIRCTYLIDDVSDDTGPFTLLPGTHRAPHACPSGEMTLPDGQPQHRNLAHQHAQSFS